MYFSHKILDFPIQKEIKGFMVFFWFLQHFSFMLILTLFNYSQT